jgi:hypothetical protein
MADQAVSNDLSPDRPWEQHAGSESLPALTPLTPKVKQNYGCGLGCLVVVIAVIGIAIYGSVVSNHTDGPCEIANEAYVLSTTLTDADDRSIAALQYAVKSAECQAQGGTDE